jgi:hypothetical protein
VGVVPAAGLLAGRCGDLEEVSVAASPAKVRGEAQLAVQLLGEHGFRRRWLLGEIGAVKKKKSISRDTQTQQGQQDKDVKTESAKRTKNQHQQTLKTSPT